MKTLPTREVIAKLRAGTPLRPVLLILRRGRVDGFRATVRDCLWSVQLLCSCKHRSTNRHGQSVLARWRVVVVGRTTAVAGNAVSDRDEIFVFIGIRMAPVADKNAFV